MVDIAGALEALKTDTGRCRTWPAATVRRRGDRRRATARVAATGVTVTLVGATAGTAYAVAQSTPGSHHTGVGIAGQTSDSPAPVPPSTPSDVRSAQPVAPSSPTPVPTPTGSRGTAQPVASPGPGSGVTPVPTASVAGPMPSASPQSP